MPRRSTPSFWSRIAISTVLMITGGSPAQVPPTDQDALPNPFLLGQEERDRGNPLAGFVELLSLEAGYCAAGQERLFFDAKATLQAALGDTQGALRSWSRLSGPVRARGPILSSPLDAYEPVDAVSLIVQRAEDHHVIMIGEEHVQPQTRCILRPLLGRLWERGFRYFAAETFTADLTSTNELSYTVQETGYYTRDPVFAEAVNEALRLGYKLVPYERTESPAEDRPDDPMFRQNHREYIQALNLKTRIFDIDPEAKVLVWAGRAHVTEEAGEVPGVGTLKPMGFQFTELTGIDPFSVYLPSTAEQAAPEYERGFYRYATHRGWVDRPTVFVNPQGETFGSGADVAVFFPRVTLIKGRPDWLHRDLGRSPVEIPRELLFDRGYQLIQAFHVQDFTRAIPMDQILIAPGDPVPMLMLPPGSRYWVRGIDDEGTIHGPAEISVPPA